MNVWNVSLLQVSLLIRRELFERAKDFNIILDDVAITELSFSREYTAAVEAKQVGMWQQVLTPPAHHAELTVRLCYCSVADQFVAGTFACGLNVVFTAVWRRVYTFLSSPAGGAASSVLCGEGQTGPETEDHPGWRRSSGCQDGELHHLWQQELLTFIQTTYS